MSSGNYLTIKDYFDRLYVKRNGIRKDSSPHRTNSNGITLFNQIFKSFRPEPLKKTQSETTGLTVADYLANPVRARYQYKVSEKSSSPETNAKKADKSSRKSTVSGIKPPARNAVSPSQNIMTPVQTIRDSDSGSSQKQAGSQAQQRIERSIGKAAGKYNLPTKLIKAVIKAESNFQVDAVSHTGAQGLMQLMPATAEELGVRNPFDIEENIDGGARYLRQMLDSFGGDIKVALAAYNAGPGAVEKYGGQVPPYQETERYINRVLRFSKQMA
jgi:soluble lytic murein transglycosylase-like protein